MSDDVTNHPPHSANFIDIKKLFKVGTINTETHIANYLHINLLHIG